MYHNATHVMPSAVSTLERLAGLSARRLALLWLVVALLFQGFATQTHTHFGGDRVSATAGVVRMATAAADSQKNAPIAPACPLCEEKALFGAYLLGGSAAITAPIDIAYHYAAESLPLLQLRPTRYAWRSRAPPLFTI